MQTLQLRIGFKIEEQMFSIQTSGLLYIHK